MSEMLAQYLQEAITLPEKREADEFTDLSSDFSLPPERKFNLQYCKIYRARLATMAECFKTQVKDALQILNVPQGHNCIVIGTIYKEMKGKPNVLQRLASGKSREKCLSAFYSEKDLTYIEDDTGRMKLGFGLSKISPNELCTGVVVALKGAFQDEAFQVSEVFYPIAKPSERNFNNGNNRVLLFASGLSRCTNFEMLKSLAQGNNLANRSLAYRVSRLIVCGLLPVDFKGNASSEIINLDADLESIASKMAVNLVPGESDITSAFFPRISMHKAFFPCCYRYSNFRSESNPFRCIIDGGEVLISCGSVLRDAMKHYAVNSELEAAVNLLRFGHLIPTGPDTIELYPYETRDPFCMTRLPNVLAFGGCREFGSEKVGNTTVICIPEVENGFVGLELGSGECYLIET